jgi:hypothetical protein
MEKVQLRLRMSVIKTFLHSAKIATLAWSSKRPKREADHSPPYSAEAESKWSYAYSSRYTSQRAQAQGYLHV